MIGVNDVIIQDNSPTHLDRGQTGNAVYDPQQSPPDLGISEKHGRAKRVYLSKQDDNVDEEGRPACVCCALPLDGEKIPLTASLDKIYHLGSGFALYFQFIKYSIGLLVLFLAVSGIFNIVTNYTGDDCSPTDDGLGSAYCVKGYILSYTLPNKREDEKNLRIQLYLNLATVIIIMVFFHIMRYSFRKTAVAADDKTVTPSDYTVAIEGIPSDASNEDIAEWLKNLNVSKIPIKIERIIRPYQLGSYLQLVAKHQNLTESETKGQQPKQSEEQHQKGKAEIHSQICETEKQLKQIKKDGLKLCSIIYITFEKAQHAYLVQTKFKVSFLTKVFGVLLSPLVKAPNNFNGKKVKVKRAPEPTDILWENLEFTRQQRSRSQLFTNFITCVLILLSFGLILLINWGQSLSVDKFGKGSIVVQILSVVTSIVITLTNFIMSFTIDKLTKYEKHLTITNYLRGVAQKLAAAQFINTALTNLVAEVILSSEENTTHTHSRLEEVNFYGKGGLLENMFWVFIISAIQSPALIIFDVGYFIKLLKRSEVSKAAKRGQNITLTQKQANDLHEGSSIPMPARFAALIKVVLLTTFYAPAIPIAAVFSIGGLTLWYWAEKYNLFRRSILPPSIDDELANSMIEYLEWAACTFAIGNIIYVFSLTNASDDLAFPHEARIVIWITLGVSLFHIFFPMGLLNETLFPIKDEVTEHQTYEQARLEFQTDYDIENPVTRKKALKRYLRRIYYAKKTGAETQGTHSQKIPKMNVTDMMALMVRNQTEAKGKDCSFSNDEDASFDFDFLDLYATKVRQHHQEHHHAQHGEHSKKGANNDMAALEKIFKLDRAASAENLAALAKIIPGIDQNNPDDEPSVHKDHLDAETIKPSIQGTRAREYATDSPIKAISRASPNDSMSSPTREALIKKQVEPSLDFFISPLTGKSRKSPDTNGAEGGGRIFLFGGERTKDEDENNSPDGPSIQRKDSSHKIQLEIEDKAEDN